MLKAASRPYVPNVRTNVLKLKSEFIPALGDTVTLCVVGARYARRVGRGSETVLVCELACAAPTVTTAVAAPSVAGPFAEFMWLFNTAALSYGEKASMSLVEQFEKKWNCAQIATFSPVLPLPVT
jgi:hypothetical protein